MTPRILAVSGLAAALAAGGCSLTEDTLFPWNEDEEPVAQTPVSPPAAEPAPAPADGPPQLGQGRFEPPGVTAGAPTGTEVGRRAEGLRGDLARLQDAIRSQDQQLQALRAAAGTDAGRYHELIAGIRTRLQVGTTPGNPHVVRAWTEAQASLDAIAAGIDRMNGLANAVADSSAFANFVLEATRASFEISGAVDEDHRQLAVLEDEVGRTVVLIDRLLTEVNGDIARQTNYVGRERGNLATLSVGVAGGEIFSGSLRNRAIAAAPPPAPPPAAATARPLVVIRFDREDVAFADPLYSAATQALDRIPGASFEVVAVAPAAGAPSQVALDANAARRGAESVRLTLTQFGLPADRVTLSATTSETATVPEVHVFLR